jgi:hypothetical protein
MDVFYILDRARGHLGPVPYRAFRPISKGTYLYLIMCLPMSIRGELKNTRERGVPDSLDLPSHSQRK